MEENNNNLGKKVAISVMSVALLGTSGYLVYDKGFRTAGKEPVKLASNTEEKKDDRITGGDLQSMFPNLVADPAKKDEKPGEKPTINLADLIGNNKSPITPVTYKPDEVSVEKKDPQIKLSDAPTPQKLDLPTNMGGPVADIPKSPTEPNKPVDTKLQVDPNTPVDPKPPVDPNTPVDPKPPVDPNTSVDPKPPVDPNTPVDPKPPVVEPKPPVVEPKPPVVDPKPPVVDPKPPEPTHPTITVSPKTGDILVEWYAGNGKYYSSVFFNDFYTSQKELDENALNNLTNYYSKKEDWTLVSQLNTPSKSKSVAEHKLALDNVEQILTSGEYSNERALFYLRNQMNVLNESVTTQEELQRYLSENKKDYIKSVAEKVYQTATEEKREWSNTGDVASLEQALSKFYLVTSVFESVDPALVEKANQDVEDIFNKLLQEELQNLNIQTSVVMSATETKEKASPVKENTSSNEEKAITEKNEATSTLAEKKQKDAKTEGAKNNEKTSNIDSSTQKAQVKSEPFSQEIDQIETYLNPANPQYEKALLLANQYVDGATGEQKEKLEQQFSAAVEGLRGQIKDSKFTVEDAINKANLLANTARVEKTVQDESHKLLMPLMFERKANDAANNGEYYTAVLNIANAIRTKHPLERSREEMVNYANKLWTDTENEWNKINGTTGWQSEVGKTLLPSYTLLAQLKDIDKTIGQISGMNMIDNASKKMEGIQLVQLAGDEANKEGQTSLYNALHYYGQAASRGVVDKTGFSNVAGLVIKEAKQLEKTQYKSALNNYQILYKTPGIEELGIKDGVKAAIEYLSTFEAAKVSGNKDTIEDLASAIELTYHSMELGYPEADAKEWMNTVALKMFNKGAGYMSATDTNNAYKCFEFLSRDKYANAINGEITKQAKENVEKIKSMNVKK
ncbi:hypothetical protein FOC89_24705 [Bacillus thuringiensis]|uniref:Group-specific protein n=1 Tax=Bacillus thuringiensis TaxID=1428 RepID=A0A0B5NS72_BACTU|nr:hypothetical protein [Bacillus thuringiensis]AJG76796.1 hypothetical protein BF38_3400 [Bacillus thuringiensis]EEM77994.1 hypothetical protein bthur0010_19850 [Bacillus thuringiensis serovar pondicheriensis BGSC 4BA1]MCU5427243.1 hypothetical protein [Bacillus cereus]QKH27011.1 hypothetical protein FOC89_24705 [Bacillus thuringiensis]